MDVDAWVSDVLDRSRFEVRQIDLADSAEWGVRSGAIRHRTNRFFSVVGVVSEQLAWAQPLFEQREIGNLGFILDRRDSPRLLVHAKIEPGNIGPAQLAPSCQATASNAARAHGGALPPHVREFFGTDTVRLTASLQSEQGTRFLDKHNRNVVVELGHDIETGPDHRWFPVDALLELAAGDYLLNTDARSVLVSTDWRVLTGREPFTRNDDELSRELRASLRAAADTRAVRASVRAHRDRSAQAMLVPVDAIPGWPLTASGLAQSTGDGFEVKQFAVHAEGREVPAWDQPMISSVSEGTAEIWCGRKDGVLHFLLRETREIGLRSLVELGPTHQVIPGAQTDEPTRPTGAQVIAQARQSDEGGRFFQDSSIYRLVDVGELGDVPPGLHALPLSAVVELIREGSWITNEARSVLSLLLPLL